MTKDTKAKASKRPYQKPKVRQVPLRPEEAVLGGCKTASDAALGNPSPPCNFCSTLGS